jgi:PHP family Zn ribbon phosphoesterase
VSEVKVVFYTDACDYCKARFGSPDTVSLKMTWKCEKCKPKIWQIAEANIWTRTGSQ